MLDVLTKSLNWLNGAISDRNSLREMCGARSRQKLTPIGNRADPLEPWKVERHCCV